MSSPPGGDRRERTASADRRARGRRRTGRRRGRLSPGPARPRRHGRRSLDVPSGEGLRRRPYPSQRRRPGAHGDRHRRPGFPARARPARVLALRHDRASLAGALELARLRPRDAASEVRPRVDRAGPEGRRAAARADRGGGAAPRRHVGDGGPRSAGRGSRGGADRDRRSVHDRRRRRRQPVRDAGRCAPRRLPPARHRRTPVLPRARTIPVRGSSRGSTCGKAT